MGVASELDPVIGLTLGVSGVTPLELTDLYATLAARGQQRDPVLVLRVTAGGRDLYKAPSPKMHPAVDSRTADVVNQVLQGVITNGTGRRNANIGRPAAGKTGTTESFRDAWFAGYTPDLAAVVWNGYPEENRFMRNVRGINVVGGSFPAMMWSRFMKAALQNVPPTPFHTPGPGSTPTPSPTSTGSHTTLPLPSTTPTQTVLPKPTTSSSPSPSPTPKNSKTSSPSPSPSPSPS
jgi:penicillin-binding protein 1A